MADSFLDFALVIVILGALGLATLILLFMYSHRMRRPFQRCLGHTTTKTVDIESGIAPKRTTIRVVKSLPSQLPQPPTPTKFKVEKQPVRRVLTNPIPEIVEAESPSQKFMFIYPKRPNFQPSSTHNEQSTYQSSSTKSSYLPNRRNSQ